MFLSLFRRLFFFDHQNQSSSIHSNSVPSKYRTTSRTSPSTTSSPDARSSAATSEELDRLPAGMEPNEVTAEVMTALMGAVSEAATLH